MRFAALAAALLLISVATLTPGTSAFNGNMRPDFWCFACGATGGADVTVNIALFVPLGLSLALLGTPPARTLWVAAGVSIAIECAQRYGFPPARVANATDIATNTGGALVGALLVRYGRYWMLPSQSQARRLIAGSSMAVASLYTLTAWALSPLSVIGAPLLLQSSAYPFTPGYGWYHGFLSRVTVNEQVFLHAGDGPVILRGTAEGARTIRVELTGRDERAGFVPFLYMHGESLAPPALLLGQEQRDARLSLMLRGSRLRLPGPHAILPDAFAGPSKALHTIAATVGPTEWSLASEHADGRLQTRLRITLGLGWTVFQTVVRNEPAIVTFVSSAWMFVLWLPLGYWCAFGAIAHRATFALKEPGTVGSLLAGVSVLALTLGWVPRWAGIAATSWVEWNCAVAGFASGIFFAWRVWRYQQRIDVPSLGLPRLTSSQ